ncbi:CHAT domain-containing protein, partial [bacterium]|nr:CHAT domain-containing protein [bacterium]
LAETYWLELDSCQLIALTACETGSGVTMSGDDIAGVSRGFMVAGTPRLVSSLWEIDDLATAILVKHFYRNMKGGDAPASALQKAQIHVRDRINPHPAYWAALLLMGEPKGNLSSAVMP